MLKIGNEQKKFNLQICKFFELKKKTMKNKKVQREEEVQR